jgi:hypothetical protein
VYDLELKQKIAKLFGLNPERLRSFTITVNPDEPILVEAIYYTTQIKDEDLVLISKEFIVLPLKEENKDAQ